MPVWILSLGSQVPKTYTIVTPLGTITLEPVGKALNLETCRVTPFKEIHYGTYFLCYSDNSRMTT